MRKYFRFLDTEEMIPANLREKGKTPLTCLSQQGFSALDESWCFDEVTLDPTRLTLLLGKTGLNGDSFKKILIGYETCLIPGKRYEVVLFG